MNNNINYISWKEITDIIKYMGSNIEKTYKPEIIISIVKEE